MDQTGLGQYTGILAVDVHGFSRHNDAQQRKIAQGLLDVLQRASDRAGTAQLMVDNVFRAYRGDGYLIGFDPDLVVDVVDNFFDSLQAELRRLLPRLRQDAIELRLRSSLHLGPLQSFDALKTDSPAGTTMVETGRMVDAEPVKALLDYSDPNVTLVAVVLSEDVMKHAVEAGRTGRQPSEFVAAPLRVESKEYSGNGYLRVPVLSGGLLGSGLLHGQPETPADETTTQSPAPAAINSSTAGDSTDKVTQAHTVHGGFRDHSVRADHGAVVTSGSGNVVASRDVDQSVNKQDFSGQFHTQGDSNFGPSSGRRLGNHDDNRDR